MTVQKQNNAEIGTFLCPKKLRMYIEAPKYERSVWQTEQNFVLFKIVWFGSFGSFFTFSYKGGHKNIIMYETV